MWYDKYPGVPAYGSPLETLFILVQRERKEAELLATKALVLSSNVKSEEAGKAAVKTFQEYCDSMFPFLDRVVEDEASAEKQRLLEHIRRPMRIDIGMIKQEKAARARAKGTEKFRVQRVAIPGAATQHQPIGSKR